MDNNIRTTIRI